jgi:hypothetical protein
MRSRKQGSGAKRVLIAAGVGGAIALLALLPGRELGAQQIHRNGFAGRETVWLRGEDNVRAQEKAHEISENFAHSVPTSERIQLTCAPGSAESNFAYYYYSTAPAPVTQELSASVWVRCSKSGVQLQARLVLPKERNPRQPDEPVTYTLVGDTCKIANRWQRLELPTPTELVKRAHQALRVQLGKEIDLADAYIDRLALNLYTGPGTIDVYIDDLEIGPVRRVQPPPPAAKGSAPGIPAASHILPPPRNDRGVLVQRKDDRLYVGGKPFFFRAIRYSNTPLKTLRDAEFNAVCFDVNTPTEIIEEAIGNGFWIIPSLPLVGEDRPTANDSRNVPGTLTARGTTAELANARDAQSLATAVGRFLSGDGVLFWDLGGARSTEQLNLVSRTAEAIRAADPQRPRGADVWDGFGDYSNSLELIGAHRFPLMTSLELPKYRDWLMQRRNLTRPGLTVFWTWIQTHMPEWEAKLLFDRGTAEGFSEPIGPQPEQIRLMTYLSMASGCKGLGFWSDRFLADSHQGRDRLLMLALLNQELRMLEPVLLTISVSEQPVWIDTSHKDVKAAVLRSDRGILVLPIWLGGGAQYVPPQGAVANLSMVVPLVPDGTQPWEISPGRVQSLQQNCKRETGGTRLTLPEFDLTAAIVFTGDLSDNGLVARWQEHTRRVAKLAAQWAQDLAAAEYQKVAKVHAELEQLAPPLEQAQQLLREAEKRLEDARAFERNNNDQDAYLEGLRAMRPLRILMRAHWDQAVKSLDLPTASPYAVSFYTLPRHWLLQREVRRTVAGTNALRDGDFENVNTQPVIRTSYQGGPSTSNLSPSKEKGPPKPAEPKLAPGIPVTTLPNWTVQETTLDPVKLEARLVPSSECVVIRPPKPEPKRQPFDTSSQTRRIEKPDPPQPTLGQTCLRLLVEPKALVSLKGKPLKPPAALERTFLAVNTPAVRLTPGTLVRITGWVRIKDVVQASADGVLLYDSVAGEGLAVRLTDTGNDWKEFHLYRRVPPSGVVWVTMALTGIGTAYFDDIRIEPLKNLDSDRHGSVPFAERR